MTLIDCGESSGGIRVLAMDNEPWQTRAKKAGLSQKTLAKLLGVAENTISSQLRGKWVSGTPEYVKTVIRAWEMLPQEKRDALIDAIGQD